MARSLTLVTIATLMTVALSAHHQSETTAKRKGTTALDVFVNGNRLELLVADDQPGGSVLVHRSSTDGATWSSPVVIEVSRGKLASPGRNVDPQIVGVGATLVAIWTAPGTVAKWGAGNLATAISRDGGKTWTSGPMPNDDTSGDEHAFIDAVADARGRFHLVWLDPRDGKQGLRYARSVDAGATWQANRSIDAVTCECCWNTMAVGWDDTPLVLYRDIPRDMAIARSDDGGASWRRTGTVGEFNWDIKGCPDVGGGLVRGRENGQLFALVFTGAEQHRGLHTLRSNDNGITWQAPLRVGTDGAWHADIAHVNGTLFAAWDLNMPNGGINWASSTDGGRTWRTESQISTSNRRATHPKLAAVNGRVTAFWTERDADGVMSWHSARLTQAPTSAAGQ